MYRFVNILTAPFFFHFGHHWLFLDFITILTNVVDTVGIFYLMLLFLVAFLIIRNTTFQVYTKNFYKNYLSFFNLIPLTNYLSFFFNNFLISISFLIDKVFFFFKKKK